MLKEVAIGILFLVLVIICAMLVAALARGPVARAAGGALGTFASAPRGTTKTPADRKPPGGIIHGGDDREVIQNLADLIETNFIITHPDIQKQPWTISYKTQFNASALLKTQQELTTYTYTYTDMDDINNKNIMNYYLFIKLQNQVKDFNPGKSFDVANLNAIVTNFIQSTYPIVNNNLPHAIALYCALYLCATVSDIVVGPLMPKINLMKQSIERAITLKTKNLKLPYEMLREYLANYWFAGENSNYNIDNNTKDQLDFKTNNLSTFNFSLNNIDINKFINITTNYSINFMNETSKSFKIIDKDDNYIAKGKYSSLNKLLEAYIYQIIFGIRLGDDLYINTITLMYDIIKYMKNTIEGPLCVTLDFDNNLAEFMKFSIILHINAIYYGEKDEYYENDIKLMRDFIYLPDTDAEEEEEEDEDESQDSDHAVDHAADHAVDRVLNHAVDQDVVQAVVQDVDHDVVQAVVQDVDHDVDHAVDHAVDQNADQVVVHAAAGQVNHNAKDGKESQQDVSDTTITSSTAEQSQLTTIDEYIKNHIKTSASAQDFLQDFNTFINQPQFILLRDFITMYYNFALMVDHKQIPNPPTNLYDTYNYFINLYISLFDIICKDYIAASNDQFNDDLNIIKFKFIVDTLIIHKIDNKSTFQEIITKLDTFNNIRFDDSKIAAKYPEKCAADEKVITFSENHTAKTVYVPLSKRNTITSVVTTLRRGTGNPFRRANIDQTAPLKTAIPVLSAQPKTAIPVLSAQPKTEANTSFSLDDSDSDDETELITNPQMQQHINSYIKTIITDKKSVDDVVDTYIRLVKTQTYNLDDFITVYLNYAVFITLQKTSQAAQLNTERREYLKLYGGFIAYYAKTFVDVGILYCTTSIDDYNLDKNDYMDLNIIKLYFTATYLMKHNTINRNDSRTKLLMENLIKCINLLSAKRKIDSNYPSNFPKKLPNTTKILTINYKGLLVVDNSLFVTNLFEYSDRIIPKHDKIKPDTCDKSINIIMASDKAINLRSFLELFYQIALLVKYNNAQKPPIKLNSKIQNLANSTFPLYIKLLTDYCDGFNTDVVFDKGICLCSWITTQIANNNHIETQQTDIKMLFAKIAQISKYNINQNVHIDRLEYKYPTNMPATLPVLQLNPSMKILYKPQAQPDDTDSIKSTTETQPYQVDSTMLDLYNYSIIKHNKLSGNIENNIKNLTSVLNESNITLREFLMFYMNFVNIYGNKSPEITKFKESQEFTKVKDFAIYFYRTYLQIMGDYCQIYGITQQIDENISQSIYISHIMDTLITKDDYINPYIKYYTDMIPYLQKGTQNIISITTSLKFNYPKPFRSSTLIIKKIDNKYTLIYEPILSMNKFYARIYSSDSLKKWYERHWKNVIAGVKITKTTTYTVSYFIDLVTALSVTIALQVLRPKELYDFVTRHYNLYLQLILAYAKEYDNTNTKNSMIDLLLMNAWFSVNTLSPLFDINDLSYYAGCYNLFSTRITIPIEQVSETQVPESHLKKEIANAIIIDLHDVENDVSKIFMITRNSAVDDTVVPTISTEQPKTQKTQISKQTTEVNSKNVSQIQKQKQKQALACAQENCRILESTKKQSQDLALTSKTVSSIQKVTNIQPRVADSRLLQSIEAQKAQVKQTSPAQAKSQADLERKTQESQAERKAKEARAEQIREANEALAARERNANAERKRKQNEEFERQQLEKQHNLEARKAFQDWQAQQAQQARQQQAQQQQRLAQAHAQQAQAQQRAPAAPVPVQPGQLVMPGDSADDSFGNAAQAAAEVAPIFRLTLTEFDHATRSSAGGVDCVDVNIDRRVPGAPTRLAFAPPANGIVAARAAAVITARKLPREPFVQLVFVPTTASSIDSMVAAVQSALGATRRLPGASTGGASGSLFWLAPDRSLTFYRNNLI